MGNVEVMLVDQLNASEVLAAKGIEAFLDVPKKRPEKFITVERTGGPEGLFTGAPMVVFQVWAKHRFEAGDLAQLVAGVVRSFVVLPWIGRAAVQSVNNFPDPDSGQARYQIVVELVTKFN